MALKGNDLLITQDDTTFGYVFPTTIEFGEPCVKVSASPQVPLNIGSGTPADTPGGVYDVRDAEGEKAITHLDWTLGAGQKSLDAEGSSPYAFYDSSCIDIENSGQIRLLRDVAYNDISGATGPVFSVGSYIFISNQSGDIYYSSDQGDNWTASTWSGEAPTVPLSGFTTDGVFVYVSVPSSTVGGVYRGELSDGAWEFTQLYQPNPDGSENISKIAFNSGMLYGAVNYVAETNISKAGIVDGSNGYSLSDTLITPAVLCYYTTIELVSGTNCVYWVVSQGSRTYVYRLYYDPAATTPILTTEQYAEFPTGFVATCACNYLSTLYVGGYWQSSIDDRGQGAVYAVLDGVTAPLFTIGERPESTTSPDAAENDNRIYSICSGTKDIYVTTNRGCYRWDIDSSGYSHVFDLYNTGLGDSMIIWNSGSDYSWDGTDYTTPEHGAFPTKWSLDSSSGTPAWTYNEDGTATVSGGWEMYEIVPDGDETLDNTLGTTIEIATKTTSSSADEIAIHLFDGVKYAKCYIGPTQLRVPLYSPVYVYTHVVGEHETGETYDYWMWVLKDPAESSWTDLSLEENEGFNGVETWTLTYPLGEHTFRLNLTGNTFTVRLDGDTGSQCQTTSIQDVVQTNKILIMFGEDCIVDYVNLNSTASYPSFGEYTTFEYAGSVFHQGRLFTACSTAFLNPGIPIVSIVSDGSTGTVTTAIPHGFPTWSDVELSGTGNGSLDSAYTAQAVTPTTFLISTPYSATTGYVKYHFMYDEGYAIQDESYADEGYLIQSETNFHTGTMKKDFRSVDVLHEPLSTGSLSCTAWVDGMPYILNGSTSGGKTTFPINKSGYSIKTKLGLTSDGTATPVVKAVNVNWDFVKVKKHQYVLDCREGAGEGRWRVSPHEAINFLFSAADKRATFEDAVSGSYAGVITSAELKKANSSVLEQPSGIVTLVVREVE